MKELLKAHWNYWKYFFGLLGTQLLVFLIFRILFASLNASRINPEFWSFIDDIVPLSFRFDGIVTIYLYLLIWLFFVVGLFVSKLQSIAFRNALLVYLCLVHGITLLLLCSDLPYYIFFNERINPSVILWANNPEMMFQFVLKEVEYYPFILLYIVLVIALFWWNKKILNAWRLIKAPKDLSNSISIVVLATLLFVGMRGGIQTRPLEVRDAYISANNFINQFVVNPVFSYLNDYLNQNINYLSEDRFESFLNKKGVSLEKPYPLAKEIEADSARNWNVVFIIMESMTGNMMKQFGNQESITPFLDSLTQVSINVKGMYTCGTHTCNGVYSSLFGHPSFMGLHPMSNPPSVNQDFYGMPAVMKEHGYQNIFFTTHNRRWDNMQIFLRKNGMDTLYDVYSFPIKKQVNAFGVPDEILMEGAISKISAHAEKGPVFATVLTISTHIPYVIADYSRFPKNRRLADPRKNIYRYADWCLEDFFRMAKTKSWYQNTLFVLVADHGINLEPTMDMPLSFHRSPFILFHPQLPPKQISSLASQTDIFPTIMGLLRKSYTNNTMGQNILQQKRDKVFFVGNTTIGCVDTSLFYVYRKFGESSLYRIGDLTQHDVSQEFPKQKQQLETEALGSLQLANEILKSRKAGKPQ